jgi:hypothetical protein
MGAGVLVLAAPPDAALEAAGVVLFVVPANANTHAMPMSTTPARRPSLRLDVNRRMF